MVWICVLAVSLVTNFGGLLHAQKECAEGYGGSKCNITCPVNCVDCSDVATCHACKPGYYNGRQIDITGFPGVQDCSNKCRDRCMLCKSWRRCIQCKPGFRILYADICVPCDHNCLRCGFRDLCSECREGYFGHSCSRKCAEGCTGNVCNISGGCTCLNNFTGTACERCIAGKYGSKCDHNCQNCLCNKETGQCEKCYKGYFLVENVCKICENGTWGENCKNRCPEKCESCKPNDGSCTICSSGKYGFDCTLDCSSNCLVSNTDQVCRIEDGACSKGCNRIDLYGNFCNQTCPITCRKGRCKWESGNCLDGCEFNYFGDVCKNTCSVSCAPTRNGSRCEERNGTCVEGCIPGYFGHTCLLKCHENCLNNICETDSGKCSHGCIEGYNGEMCSKAMNSESNNGNDKTGSVIGSGVGDAIGMLVTVGFISIAVRLRKQRRTGSGFRNTEDGQHYRNENGNEGELLPEYADVNDSATAVQLNDMAECDVDASYVNQAAGKTDPGPDMYEQLQQRNDIEQQYATVLQHGNKSKQQHEIASTDIYENASR